MAKALLVTIGKARNGAQIFTGMQFPATIKGVQVTIEATEKVRVLMERNPKLLERQRQADARFDRKPLTLLVDEVDHVTSMVTRR